MHSLPDSKRLRISGPAKDDLIAIGKYSEQMWGADQKRKYLDGIKQSLKSLAQNPALGIHRDEVDQGLRSHPVERHMVFYRESVNEVIVVRILHQSMDVERNIG